MSGDSSNNLKDSSKKFGNPLLLIASTVAIFVVSQLVAALIVQAVLSIFNTRANILDLFDKSTPVEAAYILLAEVLAVSLVLLILRVRKIGLSMIGLGRAPAWRDLSKGLLGFGLYFVILIAVTMILSMLIPGLNIDQKQKIGFEALKTPLDQVLALVALVILPPLGEEVLVRGYLYSGLRSHWKFLPAMLMTSLIFGIAHLQIGEGAPLLWAAAVSTFLLSIVLVYLRERSGALYAGILVHMLNNLVAFGVYFR